MKNIVIIHDLGEGYYQVVWHYERKGQQITHTFPKGLATTAWHHVEILISHGYPVKPEKLLKRLQLESESIW